MQIIILARFFGYFDDKYKKGTGIVFSKGSNGNGLSGVAEVLSFASTGNAIPVLHEIRHALVELLGNGTASTIDLGAIPFAAGDERFLDDVLGKGEVTATLNVMGTSHVQETAVAGVWRVDHFNEAGETQSRFIEVTFMPEILKTQTEDAADGLEKLSARLKEEDAS
ncbi:MAG: hydrogenase expression/formation protein [Rhodobacteraceae bacterium]|nr:hydrogenase expression/formation protein [Paracoccaceae bacterium]